MAWLFESMDVSREDQMRFESVHCCVIIESHEKNLLCCFKIHVVIEVLYNLWILWLRYVNIFIHLTPTPSGKLLGHHWRASQTCCSSIDLCGPVWCLNVTTVKICANFTSVPSVSYLGICGMLHKRVFFVLSQELYCCLSSMHSKQVFELKTKYFTCFTVVFCKVNLCTMQKCQFV